MNIALKNQGLDQAVQVYLQSKTAAGTNAGNENVVSKKSRASGGDRGASGASSPPRRQMMNNSNMSCIQLRSAIADKRSVESKVSSSLRGS